MRIRRRITKYDTALAHIRIQTNRESCSKIRRVLFSSHFSVWTNGKKINISYFFPIGWNRRALYPWVCNLRLWDSGQAKIWKWIQHELNVYINFFLFNEIRIFLNKKTASDSLDVEPEDWIWSCKEGVITFNYLSFFLTKTKVIFFYLFT
jgi:hypothetical protein